MKISKQQIELLMASRNLSVAQLSERSGISRQNISTIKNRGTCMPATAAKIAKGLSCSVEEFVIIEKEV